jgi:hypothetical protein
VTRYPPFTDEYLWIDVSLGEPCSVCGGSSECMVLESYDFARCTRTVSEWPVLDGGWLHRLEATVVTAEELTSA